MAKRPPPTITESAPNGSATDAMPEGSAPELTLTLVGSMKGVPQAEWDGLLGDDATPFVEWTWLDALEEAGCVGEKSGWIPQHFLLHRGTKLIAAAPAYLKMNSEGEFVFDWSWADLASRVGIPYYPKLVFAVPFTPATGERVLIAPGEDRVAITQAFATVARQVVTQIGASSAHVLFPREGEAKLWTDAGYLARAGVQFHWHNHGYTSWDDFLATFSSKRRNQIKRERAQSAKDDIHISTLRQDQLTHETADVMHTLYASTVDKFHWGRRYLNRKFFRLLVERFPTRLAWVVARKGSAPDAEIVAGAFNVQKGKRLYGRYWGGLIETPFLHFNVCYYHGIQECIDQRLDLFEPGAGGEHKRVRGFLPTVTHSAHHIAEPRMRRAVADFLVRERTMIERHVADEIGEEEARAARQAEARGEAPPKTADAASPDESDDVSK